MPPKFGDTGRGTYAQVTGRGDAERGSGDTGGGIRRGTKTFDLTRRQSEIVSQKLRAEKTDQSDESRPEAPSSPDDHTLPQNIEKISEIVSSLKLGAEKTGHSDESRPEAPSSPDDQRPQATLPQNIEKIPEISKEREALHKKLTDFLNDFEKYCDRMESTLTHLEQRRKQIIAKKDAYQGVKETGNLAHLN